MDVVGDILEVVFCLSRKASSLEAAKSRLDFLVAGKFAALGLRKTRQDSGKLGRVDFFGITLITTQRRHRQSDLILTLRWQAPNSLKGLL